MKGKQRYQRFRFAARIQHALLAISVTTAIITGLPLKFADSWWAIGVVELLGGEENRAWLHHVAGYGMIALGIFHLFYYTFIDRRQKTLKRAILPKGKDFSDFYNHMKYNLGIQKEMPKMGHFTWFEKLDYIGAAWGILVMGITGLAMLHMDLALNFIPLAWLQALWSAHSNEAMLSTLFLLIIHMYHVHFSPDQFPMSLTWWHGESSEEEMEKFHPLVQNELAEEIEEEKKGACQRMLAAINRNFGIIGSIVSVAFWLTILLVAFNAIFLAPTV